MLTALLVVLVAQAPPVSAGLTIEPRIETLRYRFENPSTYNTTELVPHFFEQTYDTDHVWIGATVRYRVLGREAETRAAFTPQATRRADDFDTFFQPDGNVVVAGTTGNASLKAWSASQRVVVEAGGVFAHGLGYAYRRDSARYHEGTRITTTTRPPSERRELVTTREYVTSQVHELHWFGRWTASPSLSFTVTASPAVVGRLEVELPDKYPGRLLVFTAAAATTAAEATWTHVLGRLEIGASVRGSRYFSWRDEGRLHLSSISLVLHARTR